jgi:hypothetical protein
MVICMNALFFNLQLPICNLQFLAMGEETSRSSLGIPHPPSFKALVQLA